MKCQSCGAIGSPGKAGCEFCGAAFMLVQGGHETPRAPVAAPQAAPQAVPQTAPKAASSVNNDNTVVVANKPVQPQVTFIRDAFNLIGELHSTAKSSFNIWAFLFPVAYLFGYSAGDNAKKVAATCLIPQFILAIVAYISWRITNALDVVAVIWFIYVSYLVATRTHALVVKGIPYNMTKGILVQVAFMFAYFIITEL